MKDLRLLITQACDMSCKYCMNMTLLELNQGCDNPNEDRMRLL